MVRELSLDSPDVTVKTKYFESNNSAGLCVDTRGPSVWKSNLEIVNFKDQNTFISITIEIVNIH